MVIRKFLYFKWKIGNCDLIGTTPNIPNTKGNVSGLGQATTGFTIARISDNDVNETADVLGYNKHSNQLSDCC